MKVRVSKVLKQEEKTSKAGKQYTLTSFMDDQGEFYDNVYGNLNQGQEIEGDWRTDAYGNSKFEVAKSSSGFSKGGGKSPEEIQSIQRQCALKAAVDVVRDFTAQLGSKPTELKDYVNQVINAATAFGRHLETGAPVVKPQEVLGEIHEEKPGEINLNDVPF